VQPALFYPLAPLREERIGTSFAIQNAELSAQIRPTLTEETVMALILLILLVLLLLGAFPVWPYSRGWGYYPSGLVGLLLIVLIILLAFQIVPFGPTIVVR
jgi:hypothetical protein